MRTFRNLKSFGSATTGITGGFNNEAVMFVCGGAGTSITVQSRAPDGSIVSVGPLTIAANQSFIYPAYVYGWTAGAAVTAYEMF
jgi:hypothetical protein